MTLKVNEIAAAFGAPFPDSGYYSEYIGAWKSIYENRPPWAMDKKGGMFSHGNRKRKQLHMAKVLCDTFSEMAFAEQCTITINNEEYQKYVDEALSDNKFWVKFPLRLSTGFALGGLALKCYLESGKPRIDYINADRFIPTRWDGNGISEGIFASSTTKGKDIYHLLEYHKLGISHFKLFRSDSAQTLGREVPLSMLYPDLPTEVSYDEPVPMFSYFAPFVSNNAEYDTPLGMSVFANAQDTLETLDVIFDSFQREFILGKKRIIVPSSCIRTVVDPNTGNAERYFDADDEAFVALKIDSGEDVKITDNTVELRVEEHIAALNAALNILCMQTGLSAGTFSFDAAQGVKTATEIISQESKSARTIKNNKNLLAEALEGVVRSLVELGVKSGSLTRQDYDITIGFADNIEIDDNTLIDNNVKLVSARLKSRIAAIMDVLKCDEETARRELERIDAEEGVGGGSVDFFGRTEGDE